MQKKGDVNKRVCVCLRRRESESGGVCDDATKWKSLTKSQRNENIENGFVIIIPLVHFFSSLRANVSWKIVRKISVEMNITSIWDSIENENGDERMSTWKKVWSVGKEKKSRKRLSNETILHLCIEFPWSSPLSVGSISFLCFEVQKKSAMFKLTNTSSNNKKWKKKYHQQRTKKAPQFAKRTSLARSICNGYLEVER